MKYYLREDLTEPVNLISQLSPEALKIMKEKNGNSENYKNWQTGWTEALRVSTGYTANALIEIFIYKWAEDNKFLDNSKIEKSLDTGKDIFVKIINELGFQEANNPYLTFFKKFFNKDFNLELSKENWIFLNDVYADAGYGVSDKDLAGIGKDKEKYILFNQNIYKGNNVLNDALNWVSFYSFLSSEANIKKLTGLTQAVKTNPSLNQNLNELAATNKLDDLIKSGSLDIRNAILFKDMNNPLGELYATKNINDVLSLANNLPTENEKEVSEKDITNAFKNAKKPGEVLKNTIQQLLKLKAISAADIQNIISELKL